MVVALSPGGENGEQKVERATQENTNRVVGIVTTIESSLITLSSGSAKVLVESEGQTEGYVSDIGGEVKKGDDLILSPLKGILMKSDKSAANVVGIAADNPGESSDYKYTENNSEKTTKISKIKVNLIRPGGVNADVAKDKSVLEKLGKTLTGRDISEARVLIALIIFVVVSITEGSIIYGAVSSSITSLGVVILVLLVGLAAVYVMLWI